MFGKKQAPKAPWSVQLLTTEYLVDGHLDGDDPDGPLFLTVQTQDLATATLTLTQASFQPTGGQNILPTQAAKWVLPSTALFVGPYAMRGAILSPDADLDILSGYQAFAMQDAVIDNLAPGARLKGLAAPYVIVRTLLVHGIVLNSWSTKVTQEHEANEKGPICVIERSGGRAGR